MMAGRDTAKGGTVTLVALFLATVLLPAQIEAGSIRISLLAGLMLVVLVPLAAMAATGRGGRIRCVDILVLAYAAWATLALAVNSPDDAVTAAGSLGLELVAPYLLARVIMRTAADFVALILCSGIAVACTLPFALYEALTHRDFLLRLMDAIPRIAMPPEAPPDLRLGLDRVQLGFGHAILYGVFCSLSVTLVLIGLKDRIATPLRLVIGGMVMLACFLSLSSGAILAVVVQFAILAWNAVLRGFAWRWWALAALCAGVYGAVDLVADRPPLRVVLGYVTFSAQNAHYRELILDWGLVNVAANPLLGLGLQDWVRPAFMVSPTVDNFWLLTAMRYGLPALLALAAAFALGLWQVGRRDLSADPPLARLRLAWLVTMAGLSVSLLTVHVWGEAASFIFFLFGAGLWMADPSDRATPPPRDAAPHSRFALRPVVRRRIGPARPDPRAQRKRGTFDQMP